MAITFRRATVSDTEKYLDFLEEIRNGMEHKDWLYLDPPELVQEMISDGIMDFWFAEDGTRLAAAFSVLYPNLNDYNYGYDLGLPEDDLKMVVHMDTSVVHPDYRGLGLQTKMVHIAEKELSLQGNRILLCTVHPENRYSLNNMLSAGYEIQKRIGKYDSERYLLRKNLKKIIK